MKLRRDGDIEDWRLRSRDDRKGAGLLLPHGLHDLVCFLAQQAAEKALKALLAAAGEVPPRNHELEPLLVRLARHGVQVASVEADAAELTPHAVLVRYPGFGHMTLEAAKDALAACDRILALVEAAFMADADPVGNAPER